VEVLSDFQAQRREAETHVTIGNLVSGQELSVILKLTCPTGREGETLSIGATVKDADNVLGAAMAGLSWTWASHAANDAQHRDRDVDVAVARVYAARARREAVEMNRHGQFAQAGWQLESVAGKIEGFAGDYAPLCDIAAELRSQVPDYSAKMSAFAQKQAHYSSLAALQARLVSGKARRTTYDAERFAVRLQRGVPVADCNGLRVLVDTGSPVSFGRGHLSLLGNRHDLPSSFNGHTIDDLRSHVGGHLDAILGTDLLSQYQCLLDLRNGLLVLSRGELPLDGVSLRVPLASGVPCADVIVHGRSGRAVIDTGARISYMTPGVIQGTPVGREKDFHPSVGQFETDVYAVDVEIAGLRLTGRFGVLPAPLTPLLASAGAEYVIGVELLARSPVLFDLSHGRMKIVQEDVAAVVAAM
jgi:hypothetical protein